MQWNKDTCSFISRYQRIYLHCFEGRTSSMHDIRPVLCSEIRIHDHLFPGNNGYICIVSREQGQRGGLGTKYCRAVLTANKVENTVTIFFGISPESLNPSMGDHSSGDQVYAFLWQVCIIASSIPCR